MMFTGKQKLQDKSGLRASSEIIPAKTGFNAIGKIYSIGDSMYYPIITAVHKDKELVGYIVRWRIFSASPQAIAQLSLLMGTNATLLFGNDDQSLWSDMVRPVSKPGIDINELNKAVVYNHGKNNPVVASGVHVNGTRWLLIVELSQGNILEAAHRFLYWLIIVGFLLVVTGFIVAWFVSRNISRPLNQLTHATTLLSSGDYSSRIVIDRQNELGKLSVAFNSMADQIKTAHADLEMRVHQRTAELEAVNKELESFSYSVSHDLRAPLRAVSGYAVILKEDYATTLDDEAKRILGNITANVRTMGQLIDDLLSFSRLGKKELSQRGSVDMKALAELSLSELMPGQETEKVQVKVSSLPNCRGDEGMIKQIWVNLIGNALKYSSKNKDPLIEIGSAGSQFEPVYYVRDNGVGFDMKYSDKLFNVFQRLHSQDEFEGTGIGLALAKRIVQKHGGRIWAESRPGEGATFFFSLSAS
jgi:signal transduction histidine kinase